MVRVPRHFDVLRVRDCGGLRVRVNPGIGFQGPHPRLGLKS